MTAQEIKALLESGSPEEFNNNKDWSFKRADDPDREVCFLSGKKFYNAIPGGVGDL